VNAEQEYINNSYHYPSSTNLHTHGLHMAAGGGGAADDVFRTVEPATAHTYTYNIVADHAAGTHWYHAHAHGSTALQVRKELTV